MPIPTAPAGPLMRITWEYTDTFSGEANYSWVRRGELGAANERGAIRDAKRAAGLSGVRCRKLDMGDTIALYPVGSCTVLFLTFNG